MLAKTSSPTGMAGDRITEPARRLRSGDAGQPEPRFLELRLRWERLGRVPHACERLLVGELDHGVAEALALLVLLARHLDAEEALEHRVAGLALPAPAHGFLDPVGGREHLPSERAADVLAVAGRGS